jgi:anaerobic magnesium-protoporphyrin IX monomethyl ester cyclase
MATSEDAVRKAGQRNLRATETVDILLVNPPTPDGGYWIRSQHRVGRRTRENLIWPQVDLAQLAALVSPPYTFHIIDANAERMGWRDFTRQLELYQPRYYLTQVAASSRDNDLHGISLAKARGAHTLAFGTHVTPLPVETLRACPALDFVLIGEPELTLRDLLDHLESRMGERSDLLEKLFHDHDPGYRPAAWQDENIDLQGIAGLAWRNQDEIRINRPRPLIKDLDDLPIPRHEALPLKKYRMPLIQGPFTFVVSSRGCPAGCTFCVKHVTYQNSVRTRSPERMMEELWILKKMGIRNIHFYADLFTVNRDQVIELCQRMIAEKIGMRWTANSRVDFVDEEMLSWMGKAGCKLLTWGIESGNEQILRHVHKGITTTEVEQALVWSGQAGIKNWGYFVIGLPGENEATVRETIAFAKRLPLEIALFFIAAPYPGTPFFDEVVREGWFRPGARWEQVDMDQETVLEYPGISSEQLVDWQKRAFREWALRPGPMLTYLKMLLSPPATLPNALSVGMQSLRWIVGG